MMQRATSEKKGWDSRLSPDLEAKFLTWSNDIPKLSMYKVPRWWNIESTRDATDISLHIFADAAQEGYGAVVYRRVKARMTKYSTLSSLQEAMSFQKMRQELGITTPFLALNLTRLQRRWNSSSSSRPRSAHSRKFTYGATRNAY